MNKRIEHWAHIRRGILRALHLRLQRFSKPIYGTYAIAAAVYSAGFVYFNVLDAEPSIITTIEAIELIFTAIAACLVIFMSVGVVGLAYVERKLEKITSEF